MIGSGLGVPAPLRTPMAQRGAGVIIGNSSSGMINNNGMMVGVDIGGGSVVGNSVINRNNIQLT